MRVLRLTIWTEDLDDTSVIVRDSDTKDTLEAHVHDFLNKEEFSRSFFTYLITDLPDGSIVEAIMALAEPTEENMERAVTERNMALGFYYLANMLVNVVPGGLLLGTAPHPYDEPDLRWVMERLSKHPDYRDQQIEAPTQDGTIIRWKEGT